MIDAHTHLNINSDSPIADYFNALNEGNIDYSVLILNSKEESLLFWNNYVCFKNIIEKIHLAFLLDINNTDFFIDNVERANEHKLTYSVKLHPRLSKITEKDFNSIYEFLKKFCFKNLIVDSFLYGSRKENICYIELSVYLANLFNKNKVIMAHFGGIKVLETMLRTREVMNIYYDCSFSTNYLEGTSCYQDLRHCIIYSLDRVMWGSDFPSFGVLKSVEKTKKLLGEQPDQVYKKIFFENARGIFFDD